MKFSTSPPTSRCTSPILVDVGSTLPTPVTYRYDIKILIFYMMINNSYLIYIIYYRHNCISAATKCYKYLRKLLKFEQMDFEFALWQMIFLFTAPQKVYRNFQSRKRKYSITNV